jgi:hypothetical protein
MKEALAKWMNKQVEIFKDRLAYREFKELDSIRVIDGPSYIGPDLTSPGIHTTDVRKIAKVLDLEITRLDRAIGEYQVELQIVWDGVTFFSMHKESEVDG